MILILKHSLFILHSKFGDLQKTAAIPATAVLVTTCTKVDFTYHIICSCCSSQFLLYTFKVERQIIVFLSCIKISSFLVYCFPISNCLISSCLRKQLLSEDLRQESIVLPSTPCGWDKVCRMKERIVGHTLVQKEVKRVRKVVQLRATKCS